MAKEKKTLTAAAIKRFPAAPDGKRVEHFDAATPGFALRVTDKGEKSFVLFSRISGKQVRLTIGKAQIEDNGPGVSLADARQTARDWITLCAKGEDPREKKEEGGTPALATLAAPVETYTVRKAVEAYEKAHISRLKPRSQLEARRPLKKILLTKWPDRALADVSKADLREVLSGMAESGNPVAANRALANLKAFFNWCLAEDRLTVNPPCSPRSKPRPAKTSNRPNGNAWITRQRQWRDAKRTPPARKPPSWRLSTDCRRTSGTHSHSDSGNTLPEPSRPSSPNDFKAGKHGQPIRSSGRRQWSFSGCRMWGGR